MPAKFLITGASGFIGFRILLDALKAGHEVRYTVRSEAKAKTVASNPAVQRLDAGGRLASIVIPDFTVEGAFDTALRDVTHVIHAGSPVPYPEFDPKTQIFEPTVQITARLLESALKTPTVQRVVITSSMLANLPLPGTQPLLKGSASVRIPAPDPIPETFSGGVFEAYSLAKYTEMQNSDIFARTQNPHFEMAHVNPGYIFGRNELCLNSNMMHTENSSNNFVMMCLLGADMPFPLHGAFVHIDDVAAVHLRVALDEPFVGKDIGVATRFDFADIFDRIKDNFPEAVEAGVFKKGAVPTLPTEYDSSDANALLGELKNLESAVTDVASQYLELLKKE